MQARRLPRIRCSSVWVYLFFYFPFYFLLLSFSQLPTLFPPGKGPFRFARPPSSLHRYPLTHIAFKPIHCVGWVISFYLPFIDVGMFKVRAVAMGKPHCNRSIRTFLVVAPTAFINLARDFILVLPSVSFRGQSFMLYCSFCSSFRVYFFFSRTPRAIVNLANAGFHSWFIAPLKQIPKLLKWFIF